MGRQSISDWVFETEPNRIGWYATIHCWDEREGFHPSGQYWTGDKWMSPWPVIGYAGPFEDEELAESWAYEHDIENQP